MGHRRLITGLLIVLLQSAAFAQANVRQEIEAFYAKWDRNVLKGNIKVLSSMIDKSFVQVSDTGERTNYDQIVGSMKEMMKTMRLTKSKITIDQLQPGGDEVVAWVTMAIEGQAKSGSKWEPFKFTMKFAETLKRTPYGWKFIYSQGLP